MKASSFNNSLLNKICLEFTQLYIVNRNTPVQGCPRNKTTIRLDV